MTEPAKYRRSIMILDMGVSEVWSTAGGREDLERRIEDIFGVHNGLGVGPGGAVLQGLFVRTWQPGTEPSAEDLLERYRRVYPLRPAKEVDPNARCVRCKEAHPDCVANGCWAAKQSGWAGNPVSMEADPPRQHVFIPGSGIVCWKCQKTAGVFGADGPADWRCNACRTVAKVDLSRLPQTSAEPVAVLGVCCQSGAENFPAPCPWHTGEVNSGPTYPQPTTS